MAGILKVDKYQDFNGNDIMTSDGSGNLTLNNAALKMTPTFLAKATTAQTLTDNAYTKIQFDSEEYDPDSVYDNSTNYRFTVPSGGAGKYCIYSSIAIDSDGAGANYIILQLYKNGSRVFAGGRNFEGGGDLDEPSAAINIVLDLAVNDYIEIYGAMDVVSGSPILKLTADSAYLNFFGAYRIIGA